MNLRLVDEPPELGGITDDLVAAATTESKKILDKLDRAEMAMTIATGAALFAGIAALANLLGGRRR